MFAVAHQASIHEANPDDEPFRYPLRSPGLPRTEIHAGDIVHVSIFARLRKPQYGHLFQVDSIQSPVEQFEANRFPDITKYFCFRRQKTRSLVH